MRFKTRFNRCNDWIAIHISKRFGTMICFYIFFVYGLAPLIFPDYMNQILYWSNFIQLISLPVLAVGQNLMDKASDRRSQKTYEMIKEELTIMKDVIKKIDPDYIIQDKTKHK